MPFIERIFPPDYRAAEGHFPGNPIIPGAALLSEVLLAIEVETGGALSPGEIKAAKFFHPTRPGDRVLIEYSIVKPGEIKFSCTVDEKIALSGQVKCAAL